VRLIRKIKTLSLDLLGGLMALTGNENNIVSLSLSNCRHDGCGAIRN
jgi:hypothetical protein